MADPLSGPTVDTATAMASFPGGNSTLLPPIGGSSVAFASVDDP